MLQAPTLPQILLYNEVADLPMSDTKVKMEMVVPQNLPTDHGWCWLEKQEAQ
jgi:hypothetical protein